MQLRIKNQDFQNESLELDNCITRDIQVRKKKVFSNDALIQKHLKQKHPFRGIFRKRCSKNM